MVKDLIVIHFSTFMAPFFGGRSSSPSCGLCRALARLYCFGKVGPREITESKTGFSTTTTTMCQLMYQLCDISCCSRDLLKLIYYSKYRTSFLQIRYSTPRRYLLNLIEIKCSIFQRHSDWAFLERKYSFTSRYLEKL